MLAKFFFGQICASGVIPVVACTATNTFPVYYLLALSTVILIICHNKWKLSENNEVDHPRPSQKTQRWVFFFRNKQGPIQVTAYAKNPTSDVLTGPWIHLCFCPYSYQKLKGNQTCCVTKIRHIKVTFTCNGFPFWSSFISLYLPISVITFYTNFPTFLSNIVEQLFGIKRHWLVNK